MKAKIGVAEIKIKKQTNNFINRFSLLKYLQLKHFSILLVIGPWSLGIIQNYLICSHGHHEK